MEKTKPFEISYQVFGKAFERVKANKGSYGIECHQEHISPNQ